MEPDPATDLIEEFINESIKPDEPAKFIFPLTQDEFSDSLSGLAEMARKSKITYEVITNTEDKKRRAFLQIAQGAANTYLVTDVFTQMETLLVEAPQAVLMVLWDEKRDDELQTVVGKFIDAGIKVLDLTNGLAELGDETEGPDEGEDESDDEDEEAEDDDEVEEETVEEGLYTRAAMEKMSHAQVKDIATGMGLPARKARENMIVAILEKQGSSESVTETSVDAQEAVADKPVTLPAHAVLESFRSILDDFGSRFFTGLEEWTGHFLSGLEGIQFNMKPEEPMDVEESEPEEAPKVRRLSRNR